MKVIADERRRVTLPNYVHAGDIFDIEQERPGCLVLTKLEKPAPVHVKLVKKGGLVLLSSPQTITWEKTRKALDEFP